MTDERQDQDGVIGHRPIAGAEIAPAAEPDLDGVNALVAAATARAFDHPDLTPAQRDENRKWSIVARTACAEAMAHPEKTVLAARIGPELAGFILVDGTDRSCPEIDWLMVAPEAHGTGAARALMDAALAWIGPGRPARLTVIDYNARAIAFYRKCGFADAGPAPEDYAIPRRLLVRPADAA